MTQTQGKEYVDQSRRSGMSDEKIRRSLNEAGWDEASIASAMAQPVSSGNPEKNWAAVTALVLGISGLLIIGPLGSVPAIIFGILGLSSAKRGMAIAGIVLGAIYTAIFLLMMVITLLLIFTAGDVGVMEDDSEYLTMDVIQLMGREDNPDYWTIRNIQRMRAVAESIHKAEGSYATATCDNAKIAHLCENISERGPGEVDIIALQDAWCASALLHEDGKYCIDFERAGEVSGMIGSSTCSLSGVCVTDFANNMR